jgi:hypothetical protein
MLDKKLAALIYPLFLTPELVKSRVDFMNYNILES